MPARKQNAKTTAKAAEPVAAETPVEQTTAQTETVEVTFADKAAEFAKKMQEVNSLLSSLRSEFKQLEKGWTREMKNAQKAGAKRKRNASPEQSSTSSLHSTRLRLGDDDDDDDIGNRPPVYYFRARALTRANLTFVLACSS